MNVTFVPGNILQIDGARITFRNFEGRGSKFNREGDRNFAVVIDDQDVADALIEEGWNVKIKEPRVEGELPRMTLPVKVRFSDRGPTVYLKSGTAVRKLNESQARIIDDIDILYCDMDIRAYNWEVNGKTGRTAYLDSIRVTQRMDRFADEYKADTRDEYEEYDE